MWLFLTQPYKWPISVLVQGKGGGGTHHVDLFLGLSLVDPKSAPKSAPKSEP
jgi:hypothetical protein